MSKKQFKVVNNLIIEHLNYFGYHVESRILEREFKNKKPHVKKKSSRLMSILSFLYSLIFIILLDIVSRANELAGRFSPYDVESEGSSSSSFSSSASSSSDEESSDREYKSKSPASIIVPKKKKKKRKEKKEKRERREKKEESVRSSRSFSEQYIARIPCI